MRIHSYENDFDLHENETACGTYFYMKGSVADPNLELHVRGGGGSGAVLISLPCWPFSLQSFLLFLPNKGVEASPRSATKVSHLDSI